MTYYDHLRSTTLVIYYITTWILLIVEISTPKPKSINFAKFQRKRTPERLFPLQNAFFLTPERFRTVFNAFLTLFERLLNAFFHSRTSKVSGTAKTTLAFFFPHQPPKSIFFGVWSLNIQYLEAPGILILYHLWIIVHFSWRGNRGGRELTWERGAIRVRHFVRKVPETTPRQTQGEVRSRRFWAKMSNLEARSRSINAWSAPTDWL